MIRRSALFMPGNHPGMLLSAAILGADSVILDLEDAVALNAKDSARILVREAIQSLDFNQVEVMVRINPVGSFDWQKDLDHIVQAKPDCIMIPKAAKEDLQAVEAYVSKLEEQHQLTHRCQFFLIAETAYGVETLVETLRASNRIAGVLLGAEDLTADMGIARTKGGQEIAYARAKVAMACQAFHVQAMDTPFTDVEDFAGLRQDTIYAKSIGMKGKALINPRQVDIVHEVFAPTAEEITYAQTILTLHQQAQEEGIGVFSYQGKMVDLPILLRAQSIMDQARKLGLKR